MLSVSAFYLLKRKHEAFAKASIKIALTLAVFASVLQLPAVFVVENNLYGEFTPLDRHCKVEKLAATGLRGDTKVPTPCTRIRYPSAVSSRSARCTVIRDTPNVLTSWFSEGIRSSGGH